MGPAWVRLSLGLALLSACRTDWKPGDPSIPIGDSGLPELLDADLDGYTVDVDCDDADPAVFPGAEELCNGVDDDCDSGIDEDVLLTYYTDADADGYGDELVQACEAPAGAVDVAGDCDDDDASVFPGAPEQCDGLDNDCDVEVDEDLITEIFADADRDGYGDPGAPLADCRLSDGYVVDSSDCDDTRSDVNPGVVELCNGVDDDCDAELDEPDALDALTFYADADGDSFGDPLTTSVACAPPEGFVEDGTDCDDAAPTAFPGAVEVCDGLDNDCDLIVDLVDDDDDGYVAGDCGGPDCDDADPAVNPGADEIWYDGLDQDCAGDDDNDADGDGVAALVAGGADCDDAAATTYPGAPDRWYDGVDADCAGDDDFDQDVDGYGASLFGGDDCNDRDAAVNPAAAELWYDGVDQDCSGGNDYDADRDGFFSDSVGGLDCDDADPAVNPAATELWYDGVDQDCDAADDFDADGDSYTSDAYGGDDCDDAAAAINPGAAELWYDGVDQDCAGDDDFDADGDSYTSDAHGGDDCDDADLSVNPGAPETWYDGVDQDCAGDDDFDADVDGYTSDAYGGDDCDDADGDVNPGAAELWYDGVDQDCAGDDDFDADGDSYTSDAYGGDDCDDAAAAVNPGASELWYDGVDQDCAGDDDFDADGDSYTSDAYGGDDCDDADLAINPGAPETWYDGVDQDCDGANDYDADGDGQLPLLYAGTDCDDFDADAYLGAPELWYDGVDQDCAGGDDFDADGDTYTSADYGGDDCLDSSATAYPGAPETWYDGEDSDCSGGSDYDFDGDGYDSALYGGDDCADLNPSRSPGEIEVWYDGVDKDCSGGSDYDADGDGVDSDAYGGADCFDEEAGMFPGNPEVCDDGLDNDCDGEADRCAPGLGRGGLSVNLADHVITAQAGDRLTQGDPGFSAAGDLNGDGVADLIVGSLRDDDGGSNAGAAYLISGLVATGAASMDADAVDFAKLVGESANDLAGRGVYGLGDVDNDGFDDIGVTALNDDDGGIDAGAVYVLYGPVAGTVGLASADAKLRGDAGLDIFADLAPAGDVDGDGFADLLVGAQGSDLAGAGSGAVFLFSGPVSTGAASAQGVALTGEAAGDEAGSSVGEGGDLDGDGFFDFVVGALGEDSAGVDAGAAYVVLGPVAGSASLSTAHAKLLGEAAGDQVGFGVSIASGGDTDNDGYDDVIIGARNDSTAAEFAGGAWLVRGPVTAGTWSLALADAKLLGERAGDYTGDSVDLIPDVDGDGAADLLLGSGYSDVGALNAGGLYLVSGAVSGQVSLSQSWFTAWAEGAEDRARVHGVGDLDDDGVPDVGVGVMLNDLAGADAGALFLFSGAGL
jgi:hypothetical protein